MQSGVEQSGSFNPWSWRAVPSGAAVALIARILVTPAMLPLGLQDLMTGQGELADRCWFALAAFWSLLLAVASVLMGSEALVRYTLRAYPLRPDAPARPGTGWLAFLAVTAVLSAVSTFRSTVWLAQLLLATYVVLVVVGLVRIVLIYRAPQAALERIVSAPFVLYLRRFGSFADRSVLHAVLRALPRGVPCVLLAANRGVGATWDPVLVGFTPLLTHARSLRTGPIFVTAPDDGWQRLVTMLATRAAAVVLDDTSESASIDEEKRILVETGAMSRTVILRQSGEREVPGVVLYRKSLLSSWPRWILGLGVALEAPHALMVTLVDPLVPQHVDATSMVPWLVLACCVATLPVPVYFFFDMFARRILPHSDVQRVERDLAGPCGRPIARWSRAAHSYRVMACLVAGVCLAALSAEYWGRVLVVLIDLSGR